MQIERYRGYEFKRLMLIILIVALVLVFFMSLFLGRYPIPPQTVISILIGRIIPIHDSSWPHACETVIF